MLSTSEINTTSHLLTKELARRDYEFYLQYVYRGFYKRARHLTYLSKVLQRIADGESLKLMILMPPRHGKSMTVSSSFPSYFLGRNPNKNVIVVSYGEELAQRFGRENREKLESFGPSLFGLTVDPSQSSKVQWLLSNNRGGMISVGLGGAITGQGAHLLIIDDPIKNRQEADSPTYRKRLWSEYRNTLLTRLQPKASIIVIQTRWHKNDLAGKLLQSENDWEVIKFPAIAEEHDLLGRNVGDPLWPEFGFDKTWATAKEKEVGPYVWSALYQQSPTPVGGGLFRREWFDVVYQAPQMRTLRYWDLAASKNKRSDFTSGTLAGVKDGIFYILDVQHHQKDPLGVKELLQQTAVRDGRRTIIWIEQEGGASGKSLVAYYKSDALKGYVVHGDEKHISKLVRAEPLAADAAAGKVRIVKGDWNEAFLSELEVFPFGANDDQVDSTSGAYSKLVKRMHSEDDEDNAILRSATYYE